MPSGSSVALVTGAAGFIGANLVRRLAADGVAVHAVVRRQTSCWRLDGIDGLAVHEADLTDPAGVSALVSRVRPDVVFHLARQRGNPAGLDERDALAHNVAATRHLLDAVLAYPVARFVHAGSSLEYDLTRSPQREDAEDRPLTVHGMTKAAATRMVQAAARDRGVPAVVLRLFTVYGQWEGHARLVPSLMRAALDGRPIRLTPGGLSHDWIHVDDVVDACLKAASALDVTGEIVNVATGVASTNETLVATLERVSGRTIPRALEPFPARPWDTGTWVADVTKARALLGFVASRDLTRGLGETLAWFRAHRHRYPEAAPEAAEAGA